MDDCLRSVASRARGALVSAEAWTAVETLATDLPPVAVAGFECRLGHDRQVDFAINLGYEHAAFPARLLDRPVWRTVHELCATWRDPGACLFRAVVDLWLEFDLVDGCQPVPGVFLSLLRSAPRDFGPIIDLVSRAFDCPVPPGARERLADMVRLLPPGGRVIRLGLFFGRGARSIRVELRLPPPAASTYLEQIGWRGRSDIFSATLAPLWGAVDLVNLDVDVGETVQPSLGIECMLRKQPAQEPRWEPFLASLVDAGLCQPQKAGALLAWPGAARLRSREICFRQISHVKLGYDEGRLRSAKAYLMFRKLPADTAFKPAGNRSGA